MCFKGKKKTVILDRIAQTSTRFLMSSALRKRSKNQKKNEKKREGKKELSSGVHVKGEATSLFLF